MAYTPNEWACGDTLTAEKLNNIERGISEMNDEYVPTEWQCGDTITAEKLNKIEQGIASGGGSSDFSTAKLTVTGSSTFGIPISISRVSSYEGTEATAPAISENGIYDVILYKGVAFGAFDTEESVSITGSGEYDDGDLIITGDCTITIS